MTLARLIRYAVMLAAGSGGGAVAEVALLAHHAQYDLSLQSSPNGSVVSADGSMDYQISDACDAWATSQRLDVRVVHADGSVTHMISDYVTWEQKDGALLRFRTRQTSDGKTTADVQGEATRRPDGTGRIRYTAPAAKQVDLPPGTMFPLAQTVALLADAAKGQKFLSVPLFDGTDEDGAEDSFSVMGAFAPGGARWPALRQVPSGRVTINFFDPDKDDDPPSYDVAMRYWQNGVSDDVAMDFGDFVVKARLTNLTPNGKRC